MNLIPEDIRARLLAAGAEVAENDDHIPLVKLFTPDAAATWLISEIDPEQPTIAFGLCDLGMGSPELGYVSLEEIGSIKGPLGSSVERDLSFKARYPLSVYLKAARRAQAIVEDDGALAAFAGPRHSASEKEA